MAVTVEAIDGTSGVGDFGCRLRVSGTVCDFGCREPFVDFGCRDFGCREPFGSGARDSGRGPGYQSEGAGAFAWPMSKGRQLRGLACGAGRRWEPWALPGWRLRRNLRTKRRTVHGAFPPLRRPRLRRSFAGASGWRLFLAGVISRRRQECSPHRAKVQDNPTNPHLLSCRTGESPHRRGAGDTLS